MQFSGRIPVLPISLLSDSKAIKGNKRIVGNKRAPKTLESGLFSVYRIFLKENSVSRAHRGFYEFSGTTPPTTLDVVCHFPICAQSIKFFMIIPGEVFKCR